MGNFLLEPLQTTSSVPTPGSAGNGHAKLFISYLRKDRSFVERLSEARKAGGQDTWVDLTDILPSEDWPKAIRSAIEGADGFIFTVSPESIDPTSVCLREVEHAIHTISELFRSFAVPSIHAPLRYPRRSEGSIGFPLLKRTVSNSRSKIMAAIETDLAWVKQHTRLLERAVESDAAKIQYSGITSGN
jgi:hypothetical protein